MDKAFFPYGNKSKEFLIKRALYLVSFLYQVYKVDMVILGCNTLSIIALPFINQFYELKGVFEYLRNQIDYKSVIIGSRATIEALRPSYNNLLIDGTELIEAIEKKEDYTLITSKINRLILNHSNIILACTHFLALKENTFIIKEIRNK